MQRSNRTPGHKTPCLLDHYYSLAVAVLRVSAFVAAVAAISQPEALADEQRLNSLKSNWKRLCDSTRYYSGQTRQVSSQDDEFFEISLLRPDGSILVRVENDGKAAAWLTNKFYVASLRTNTWESDLDFDSLSQASWSLTNLIWHESGERVPKSAEDIFLSPNRLLTGYHDDVDEIVFSDTFRLIGFSTGDGEDKLVFAKAPSEEDSSSKWQKSRCTLVVDPSVFDAIKSITVDYANGSTGITTLDYILESDIPVLTRKRFEIKREGKVMWSEMTAQLEPPTRQVPLSMFTLASFGLAEPSKPHGSSHVVYTALAIVAIAVVAFVLWQKRSKA